MSGPENIRGVDYQITTTCLLLLHALTQETEPLDLVKIDSLDDESEDLELRFVDGRQRQVQLKKLTEGYNWTPSRLKPILVHFAGLADRVECVFVTDGSIGTDVAAIKPYLEGRGGISDELRSALIDNTFTVEQLESLVGRVQIMSRFFPSADAADPAAMVRREVESLIVRGPFSLSAPAAEVALIFLEVHFYCGPEWRRDHLCRTLGTFM